MSIRFRIIIAIFLVAFVPISVLFVLSGQMLRQNSETGLESARTALEEIGQKSIQQKAEDVAAQIQIYLQSHPNLNPSDITALQADKTLASIAVQPVGKTGYTAVHDSSGTNIFHNNPKIVNTSLANLQEQLPDFWQIVKTSLDGTPAAGYYDWVEADNSIRKKYMVIVPVTGTPLRVAATTYIDEFSQPATEIAQRLQVNANDQLSILGLVAFISAIVAVVAAILLSRQITTPLIKLTQVTQEVAQGKWDAIVPQETRDEIGILSQSIHGMARQLSELIENLDGQVRARTKALERRTAQLEAVALIARDIAQVKHVDMLIKNAVELISERFGFYHVGIFLVDETREYAQLVAANETGQKLVENKHQIKVGETGIVGTVVATGYARIAQNVADDQVHFKNPLLPDTRSEMAIPLRAGGEVIGALDIQSTQESAFDEEDINVLQVLADQLANAIENARVVERLQNTNKEMAALAQKQSVPTSQLWTENEIVAYEYDRFRTRLIDDQIPSPIREQLAAGQTIVLNASQAKTIKGGSRALLLVPLTLRGKTLGAIGLESSTPDHQWTNEEIATVESIAAQAAVALENARLLEDAQQRASQEKNISDITAKVSSSIKIESVLRTAAQELSRVLQDSEVLIQLNREE